jgi:hypothetical protein
MSTVSTAGCHTEDPQDAVYNHMKRLIALAVMAIASQARAVFAGEPMVSSKQVIAPPVSYFRGNEFDLGAFATYVTGTQWRGISDQPNL